MTNVFLKFLAENFPKLYPALSQNSSYRLSVETCGDILRVAAKEGRKDIIEELFEKYPLREKYIDLADPGQYYTALMLAAAYDKPDCFELLLRKGADPHLLSKKGNTALWIAAVKERDEIVKRYFQLTGKPKYYNTFKYWVKPKYYNEIKESEFEKALKACEDKVIMAYMGHGLRLNEPVDLDSKAFPIECALKTCPLKGIEKLIELSKINESPTAFFSLLNSLTAQHCEEKMLQSGVPEDKLEKRWETIVKLVHTCPDLNRPEFKISHIFHTALEYGEINLAYLLLDRGFNPLEVHPVVSNPPLWDIHPKDIYVPDNIKRKAIEAPILHNFHSILNKQIKRACIESTPLIPQVIGIINEYAEHPPREEIVHSPKDFG